MRSNKFFRYLFFFSLLLLFYDSMYAYFLWNIKTDYITVFAFFSGILYHIIYRQVGFNRKKYLVASLFFLVSMLYADSINSGILILRLLKTAVLYMVLTITIDRKKELLKIITTSFSVIMGVSIVAFFLGMIVNLPSFGSLSFNDGQYEFTNYLLYIKPYSVLDIYRFNSIFLEPGHVAMIAAYLLFANDFDFKHNKYLIPIFIAVVVSLSLAGYVLVVAGYLLSLFPKSKKRGRLQKLFYFALLLLSVYYLASVDNGGSNVLNDTIFSRLQYDTEKGIVGNNRTTAVADVYFEEAIKSGEIITGYGRKEYNEIVNSEEFFGGAGYKIYMLKNGIIGTILVFMFYLFVAEAGPNKKKLRLMLLLYSFSFLQRAYPEWWAWILPFVCCGVEFSENPVYNPRKIYESSLYS